MRAGALEKPYTGFTLSLTVMKQMENKNGIKMVGIGNFAEQSLGDIHYSLHEVGKWLKKMEMVLCKM